MFIFNSIKYANSSQTIFLEPYESTQGSITGYKIYNENEQVATLEFRNSEWIAAMLEGAKLKIKRSEEFSEVCDWIEEKLNT